MIVALVASTLLLAGCGEQAAAHRPSPSAAVLGQTASLPPLEPGVVNFKLTLQSVIRGDGFEVRFDVPHSDQNLFQFCDPLDNPCVAGKTYGIQFRPIGPGKVAYAFRRQIRFGATDMQVESFKSGTVDLTIGGEFVAVWPTST
jgi:hypothetical protein